MNTVHFSAFEEDLPVGFKWWEVKGFSRGHGTPTVILTRIAHRFQQIFEDLVWSLLCFITISTEVFLKQHWASVRIWDQTQAVLFPEIQTLAPIPCPWVSEACFPVPTQHSFYLSKPHLRTDEVRCRKQLSTEVISTAVRALRQLWSFQQRNVSHLLPLGHSLALQSPSSSRLESKVPWFLLGDSGGSRDLSFPEGVMLLIVWNGPFFIENFLQSLKISPWEQRC